MEPVKFEKNQKGNWVLTQAWKDWKDAKFKRAKKSEFKPAKAGVVTEENHTYRWKEVAVHIDTGRAILFCACMSGTNEPFRGCGATAIRSGKTSQIKEILESRWQ
jgi:hypothetical protein